MVGVFALVLQAGTGLAAADTVTEELRSRVDTFQRDGSLVIEDEGLSSASLLPDIYARRNYQPLWSDAVQIERMLKTLRDMDREGLTPSDYHLRPLVRLQNEVVGAGDAAAGGLLADRDLLLTDALIRICYHLLFGKVDPVELSSHWNFSREIGERDPATVLTEAVETDQVDGLLDVARPDYPAYANLIKALGRYRKIETDGGWTLVPSGATLREGDRNGRVTDLRNRLAVTGALVESGHESALFDQNLVDAVQGFQRQHGLDADGVVGPATLVALNVSVAERIDQIRVNLERARWVLHNIRGRFVLVDIAGFRVAYFEDGQPVWTARAQVGRPYRKTPVFKSQISYLEFNPTWTVPPTILNRDVLPAIHKNPDYLTRNEMRVLTFAGEQVDPASIEWQHYPRQGFPYMLRQDPGPKNALGRVKFMFPNDFLVYLHDTPSRNLFGRTNRAFSSGCIRVEQPFELAKLLLDDAEKWNDQSIQVVLDTRRTRRVNLPEPVTVMLMYWTVNAGEDGRLTFKPDIYGRDRAILEGLNRGFRFSSRHRGHL